MTGGAAGEGELVAALLALAGARTGDPVAAVGASPRVERALLAMSSTGGLVVEGARVAVAGSGAHLPEAVSRCGPGARVVAVAPSEAAARHDAASAGVAVLHVSGLGGAVAWSGRVRG